MIATIAYQLAGIGIGFGMWQAASRGWLGWRWSGRGRATFLGVLTAVLGPMLLRGVVSGVAQQGLRPFIASWVVSMLLMLLAYRAVRNRWPSATRVAIGALIVALLLPTLFADIVHLALTIGLPVAALLLLYRYIFRSLFQRSVRW